MMQKWLMRGLLATLLLFGGEVLLWPNPTAYNLLDWLLRGAGYLALSALLLDWMARYHVHELFGLLVLTGVSGLLAGLLFGSAALDLPYRMVTLALGAYTALGLGAWLVLLRRGLWLLGAGSGIAWGIWVQWGPYPAELVQMLAYGLVLLAVIGVLTWAAREATPAKLNLAEWALLLLVIGGLLALRWNRGDLDGLVTVISAALIAYCWLMLWFQRRDRAPILLDKRPSSTPFALLIAAALFLIGGAVGYHFPFDSTGQQRDIISALFTAFGMVWLPTVSLVLGIRAYRRDTRQRRL